MDQPRIAPGGLKELGLVNYGVSAVAGRVLGSAKPHIFTTLGRQRKLFRGWLYYSGKLMPGGRLPSRESELVILRIATIRECEYERRHHVRIAQGRGDSGPDRPPCRRDVARLDRSRASALRRRRPVRRRQVHR